LNHQCSDRVGHHHPSRSAITFWTQNILRDGTAAAITNAALHPTAQLIPVGIDLISLKLNKNSKKYAEG
jgi:hypothetical protein